MLNTKQLREDFEVVEKALSKRKGKFNLSKFKILDEARKEIILDVEKYKSEQNIVSKQVPVLKKEGKDVSKILEDMKVIALKIKELDPKLKKVEEEIKEFLLNIPNIPHESVPKGESDEENKEIKKVGEITTFDFEPKPHWELGEELNILDPTRAAKVTGSRFHFYKGDGARLERALYNFMLDTHNDNGYTEIIPPAIVNRDSMQGTGQLPKFEEDLFKLQGDNGYYLIPTAEVPLTNLHRNEILKASDLPIKYCALSTNFRAEAGSAGRDTRGLIRQHQFAKVELVLFTKEENSFEALEGLLKDSQRILDLLELPYRIVNLCTGDLGFSSTKTYDIEVWMPSYNRYVEISSCSNFIDFQGRRSNIRYKNDIKDKSKYIHTLNGSGLALGRTVAAVLENYQQSDGSIKIPKVLKEYFKKEKIVKQK